MTHDHVGDAAWSEFVAEARELLARVDGEITSQQLDRLEAISDALIHVLGYTASLSGEQSENDPTVRELLVWRRRRARNRDLKGGGTLSSHELRELAQRILTGLHAYQLRVREEGAPPYESTMETPRVPSRQLLSELEQAHRALVVPELAIAAGVGLELWDIACSTTVDVPSDVPKAKHLALQVAGDSMEPLIHSGDLLLVRLDARAFQGSVVVARDPDHGYVVKEVGRLTANGIELRSLNPAYSTLHVPHATGAVLGTVVLRWAKR